MNIIYGSFNSFLSLFLLLTLAGCAEMPKDRLKTISESLELLHFTWLCEATALAGSQAEYRVRLKVSGSGDLTGNLGEDNGFASRVVVPGAPAGHCEDILNEAITIARNQKCSTSGSTYHPTTLTAYFLATCGGTRKKLIAVMGYLMQHGHTLVINTP